MYESDVNLIEAYGRALRQQGKSDDNADCLCRPAMQFSKFLLARQKSLLTAEAPDCKKWLEYLSENGIVDRSKSSKLSLLHVFYQWLITTHRTDYDPTVFSRVKKTWTNKPRSVSKKKLRKILDQARTKAQVTGASLLDIRNWAILELFYGCGARVSELALLSVNDLSLEQGDVLIHGKRLKDRLPPFTDAAGAAVAFYLGNARDKLVDKDHPDEALFLSRRGRKLGRGAIGIIVKKADPDLSPHILRHCYAQHRADGGERIEIIQHDLGHAITRSTEVYVPSVPFKQLQSEHQRCHPRGRDFSKHDDRSNANSLPPG